jgi:urease accessory protein
MIICSKLMPQGRGLARVLIQRASTLTLDWDTRQKSRFDATDSQGRALGVFLPRGAVVRGGDVLVAEDGSLVRVQAAPQDVLRITACTEHGSPFDLTRAAYHLGNRHVPIELQPDHLKIEPDHVLADMLRAMHMTVVAVSEPFEPENGAYGDHGASSHGHGHSHDHGHAHAGHAHAAQAEPHVHGPDCQHEHAAPAAKPPAGKRIAIPVRTASAQPHVHGPGCGHAH